MTLDDPCPMTGERHPWGEWERVVEGPMNEPERHEWRTYRVPTGDRAHECRTCGRWDLDWADAQSQREETL